MQIRSIRSLVLLILDPMAAILQKVKRAKVESKSPYIDLRFIRPTSNICERLFSLSKFALPDNRFRRISKCKYS